MILTSCTKKTDTQIEYKAYYTQQIDAELDVATSVDFKPLTNEKISYKNGWYWFKIDLKNKNYNDQDLVFNIQEPSLDSLRIYNSQKQIVTHQKLNLLSFKIRHNKYTTGYYIKAHFKRQVHFPLKIYPYQYYPKILEKQNLGTGLYYGLVVMVFVFNLIFYFFLKDESFLYYCLFLASINISFTGFDGVSNIFLSDITFEYAIVIFHFLIQVFGVVFAVNFLGLQNFYPKLNRLGVNLLFIPAILYLFFFATNNFIYLATADLLGLLILTFYWVLGILMIKKETFAVFFVIGYSMVLFAGIFYLVPLNFGIPYLSVSFTQLKIGALFEMLVLTFATIYRVKLLQEENKMFSSEIKNYVQQIVDLETKINTTQDKATLIEEKVADIVQQFNLTAREGDLLLQIVKGLNNQQIAEKLFITVNTVKYHTRNIYEKLDVKKRGEIITKILFDEQIA